MTVRISWALCNPCPVCGHWTGALAKSLAKLNLVECTGCGHVFSFPEQTRDAKASTVRPFRPIGHHTTQADKPYA